MMKVYVSGPYTLGDKDKNVAQAIDAGQKLLEAGAIPFIPHLSVSWEALYGDNPYELWMTWAMAWLGDCEAMVRLPGESRGADREVEWARSVGINIFDSVEELLEALQ